MEMAGEQESATEVSAGFPWGKPTKRVTLAAPRTCLRRAAQRPCSPQGLLPLHHHCLAGNTGMGKSKEPQVGVNPLTQQKGSQTCLSLVSKSLGNNAGLAPRGCSSALSVSPLPLPRNGQGRYREVQFCCCSSGERGRFVEHCLP